MQGTANATVLRPRPHPISRRPAQGEMEIFTGQEWERERKQGEAATTAKRGGRETEREESRSG